MFLDVCSLYVGKENAPKIIGGRYGLSSKDTNPDMINAVFENLAKNKSIHPFTVGINDDINHTNVVVKKHIDTADKTTTELLFFGLGSDGTVGACKNISKIIGDYTDFYSQSYAAYDSKKSGGSTRLHLRFSKNPIRSTYLVNAPHFVSCSLDAYLKKFDMIKGLRNGGTFLLNTVTKKEDIERLLPNSYKIALAKKHAKLYIIDGTHAAAECGFRPGLGVNTIMQSAFFKLNEQIMSFEEAKQHMKEFAIKTYSKKGQELVDMNIKAIDMGETRIVEVPVKPEWANLSVEEFKVDLTRPAFVRNIADPIARLEGDNLPLSVFKDRADASMPVGTAAFEKRGVASQTPIWDSESCIQCNQCAFACPHAAIRPFLVNEEEAKKAPKNTKMIDAMGVKDHKFVISISTLDCTGCGVCTTVCPGKPVKDEAGKPMKDESGKLITKKALKMVPIATAKEMGQVEEAEYFYNKVSYKSELVNTNTAKNVQFSKPLFEFSGACAGCGETPYVKAVSQLFGDHMIVANATGCTSIYSGSYPSSPYTTNSKGQGPAWANSLFEDNAEFGLGMRVAYETMRDRIQNLFANNEKELSPEQLEVAKAWVENRTSYEKTKALESEIIRLFENDERPFARELMSLKQYIVKASQWIIGGDGWAYDIGYGGLDHVLASGEDVNVLVVDTEVYSNTGGQASKSSRFGAIAKFAAAGKRTSKKDLASIFMSYGNIYVATVCHGANQNQVIKALKEAEAYHGPSIVICYAPCIAHNIKGGLNRAADEARLATECGYFPTFRYNPLLEEEGKNPFTLDSKEPNWDLYEEFLSHEGRYNQLLKINPEKAQAILEKNKKDAQKRYYTYVQRVNNPEYNK